MEKISGKGEMANMPQEVKITKAPKCSYISNQSDMDDTMTGIDSVNGKSTSKASKHKSNQK
jgi:hypothetical protein